ncbi:UvrD-helicase domain-containing protein [Actinomycetospora rhizophila]|uniref:UvrD-helicase domain-containing protein n=1 Tax=Actinomycetospora rhizophila TaxID=1416876 RepID=A0ABV9ZBZ8_9PSEU
MSAPDENYDLTDEQRRIVELPADATTLVTAGPGTGKTHTLAHRVAHLLDAEGLAGHEVLVLTFSRAAVATLRHRLRELGGDVARVRARTFDSWALEILREAGREGIDLDGNFDRRIREATQLLGDDSVELREDLRHVVVDEVQDLVGARRRLVHTLLSEFECGFTLVGDLAQAIYGFQADTADRDSTFIADLRRSFPALVELELSTSFRFKSDDARRALVHGVALRDNRGQEGRLRELRDTLESLDHLGPLGSEFALGMLRETGTSTAILCRTNGEALLVSETLRQNDVRHRLRRAATDRAVPGWLAELVDRSNSVTLTRDRFDAVAQDLGLENLDVSWSLLLRVAADRGRRVLDLVRLRDAIAAGRLPDEIVAEPEADLVVSSFHRAKGLEFDHVIIVDPSNVHWKHVDAEASGEEARLLYVALTRARDQLWATDPVRSWQVRKADKIDRWGRYGREPWKRLGLEGGAGDVEAQIPGWYDDRTIVEQEQAGNAARLRSGDLVDLVRTDTVVPDGEAPDYTVMCRGEAVGGASPRFRRVLRGFMQQHPGSRPRTYPSVIRGLRVDSLETVVEGAAATRQAGLNDLGVRRVPRLVGLSWFEYAKGGTDA